MLSFKPSFSLSSFNFIKSVFSSSLLSTIGGVSSACPRLLIFLPAILIPACASSNPAFLLMYSAYKLNKQGDNIEPWRTPFPIWNVNRELPDVQARFRKGRGTRDQIANIRWIMEKAREFQKNIYFSFIDYAKAFDCVDHNKLWKILKEMGIPDHLICLLRNLYAGQQLELDMEQQTGSK